MCAMALTKCWSVSPPLNTATRGALAAFPNNRRCEVLVNRRDFIRMAGAVGVASTAVGEPLLADADPPATTKDHPRQAIVFLGESVRYDMLNCNANTGLKTPNL